MDEEEAIEHFHHNVCGSYMGEKTPIWCWDDFSQTTIEAQAKEIEELEQECEDLTEQLRIAHLTIQEIRKQ